MRLPFISRMAALLVGWFALPVQMGPAGFWTALALSAGALAMPAAMAAQSLSAGEVDVGSAPPPITVTVTGSTADLNNLANVAFAAHGRYKRVAGGAQFDLRFTAVAPNQVRVDVTGGAQPLSQVATGTSARNALLRAADLAVKATSGLNGFFASQVAFVSNRTGREDIYTTDLFFTEVRQVTSNGAAVLRPRWSPDGRKLIFTSYSKGFPDIYVLDLPSMHTNTFVSLKGSNLSARFSPDGREVVMVLTGEGPSEIYTSDALGRGITRRTRSDTVKSSPGWSPDGSRIIFAGDPGPQLQVMPAAGGVPQRLSTGGLSTYCAEPDWSRGDPDKIAFTVRKGQAYQVAICSLSGKVPAKLVSSKVPAADALEPAWLADGRHLICTARMANVRVLYLVDTETLKATRLSPASLGECAQASVWGP
jgi:TolB protein